VWDAFCAEVDRYPLDRVSEITWVPKKEIQAAARFFAESKPASIHWGLPIDSTPGITPAAQAITALWCLTGNLEVPGGNVIARNAFECVSYALPGAKGSYTHPKGGSVADRHRQIRPVQKIHLANSDGHGPDQILAETVPSKPSDTDRQPDAGIGFEPESGAKLSRSLILCGLSVYDPHNPVCGYCPARRHVSERTASGQGSCRPSASDSVEGCKPDMKSILSWHADLIRTCAGNPWRRCSTTFCGIPG
jgi:hypothetical protein